MPKYKVKEALSHDGEDYLPGDTVEMPAKEAKRLIDLKVLAAEKKAAEKNAGDGETGDSKAGLKVVE